MREISNKSASNFRKLLNQTRANHIDFNTLLKRYLQERFLSKIILKSIKNSRSVKFLTKVQVFFAKITVREYFGEEKNYDNKKSGRY